jgi:peptide-methionine (R)-S-oxide reductase
MASSKEISKLKIIKSDKEWKETLTPEEYKVLRYGGTDPPLTGKYVHNKEKGIYTCAGCSNELFSSDTKYESGTGWPSFRAPISKDSLEQKTDKRLGMNRTEVLCNWCGGHLGHIFDDGSQPTGQRFCINSTALRFKEQKKT